jgi:germination protein M
MPHKKTTKLAMLFLIISLLLSGCIFGPAQTKIDPPPSELGTDTNGENTLPVTAMDLENAMNVTMYFYDENKHVTPMTLPIPKVEAVATAALSYMVKGGPGEALLPAGFSAILPAGTTVEMNIIPQEKLAIVDFSKEFLNYTAEVERDLLEAVTWTITGFPTVDKVQFRVAGQDMDVMPVAKTPIDRPLSRAMGINMEAKDNVEISRTMPVTLYFQGTTTAGDFSYYVPVTRLVPKGEDVARATIQELIFGPKTGSSLVSNILPSTELLEVAITGDTVTADFSKDLLSFGEQTVASAEAIQTIVLSLTENTGMEKVQIMVDGSSNVTAGKQTLDKPVNRPIQINERKF